MCTKQQTHSSKAACGCDRPNTTEYRVQSVVWPGQGICCALVAKRVASLASNICDTPWHPTLRACFSIVPCMLAQRVCTPLVVTLPSKVRGSRNWSSSSAAAPFQKPHTRQNGVPALGQHRRQHKASPQGTVPWVIAVSVHILHTSKAVTSRAVVACRRTCCQPANRGDPRPPYTASPVNLGVAAQTATR